MEIKDKGGRTLEFYDGIGGLTFKIYKEKDYDDHRFFIDDETAQKIIDEFNHSEHIHGFWINTR